MGVYTVHTLIVWDAVSYFCGHQSFLRFVFPARFDQPKHCH